jgi:hypothetical protein
VDTQQRAGSDEAYPTGNGGEAERSAERVAGKFSVVPIRQAGIFDPGMVAPKGAAVAGERKVVARYRFRTDSSWQMFRRALIRHSTKGVPGSGPKNIP